MQAQDISIDVLAEKYAKGSETSIEDIHARVARALAAKEADPARCEALFREALAEGFVPAGRSQSTQTPEKSGACCLREGVSPESCRLWQS